MPKRVPRGPQESPREPQESAKRAQESPRAPGLAQESFKKAKVSPRETTDEPREPQESPKGARLRKWVGVVGEATRLRRHGCHLWKMPPHAGSPTYHVFGERTRNNVHLARAHNAKSPAPSGKTCLADTWTINILKAELTSESLLTPTSEEGINSAEVTTKFNLPFVPNC